MTESEPQFIVRTADGKKSKPVSKARIREMHSAGEMRNRASVTLAGRSYQIPIHGVYRLIACGQSTWSESGHPVMAEVLKNGVQGITAVGRIA